MLVGISLCKPPLQAQVGDGNAAAAAPSVLTRMATLYIGDLCGSETFDMVCSMQSMLCMVRRSVFLHWFKAH